MVNILNVPWVVTASCKRGRDLKSQTISKESIKPNWHFQKGGILEQKNFHGESRRWQEKKHIVDLALPSGEFFCYMKRGYSFKSLVITCLSFLQKYDTNSTNVKDDKVVSFTWDIQDFPASLAQQRDGNQPLTSDVFPCEGQRWRAVLTGDHRLYLQLTSSSHPVTAEIR